MVPVEWPLAAAAPGEAVLPARASGDDRLRTARIDFFLDPAARLSEQERALMGRMLADLVNAIADELRAELSNLEPANDEGRDLFEGLRSSGLLDIAELVGLLLRRSEEERIAASIRAGQSSPRPRLLQSLVSDDRADVSAAAMGLILARGRRRDRFGGPVVTFDDVPAEAAVLLVNAIAACLRSDLARRHGAGTADDRLPEAARAMLSRHDEGNRLEARLFELAHALDSAAKLDEAFVLSALEEGEVALLAEILGRRAGIGFDSSWKHFRGPRGQLALLLRMSCVSRNVAGEIVVRLADVIGSDVEAEISAFDSLSEEDVEKARKWQRLDSAYRSAIENLAKSDGQRSV